MARTTTRRVKIDTGRALDLTARAKKCDVPEVLSRVEDGDLDTLALWQHIAKTRPWEAEE